MTGFKNPLHSFFEGLHTSLRGIERIPLKSGCLNSHQQVEELRYVLVLIYEYAKGKSQSSKKCGLKKKRKLTQMTKRKPTKYQRTGSYTAQNLILTCLKGKTVDVMDKFV